MKLAYTSKGNPHGSAILLQHGYLSSNAQWLLNETALGEHHHLVMVELWGHGNSPLPEESAFSIDEYVEQYEQIRHELGIEQWALIGQSYGAGLTINYARTHPDFCTAVIVTNSRSAFGDISAAGRSRKSNKNSQRPTPSPDTPPLQKLPFHPVHAKRFPAGVRDALVASADAMDPEVLKKGRTLGTQLNCTEILAKLMVPLMVINGRFEKAWQAELAAVRARYPDLHVVDLDGGHSVNIEAAEPFNTCVLDYLSKLPSQ